MLRIYLQTILERITNIQRFYKVSSLVFIDSIILFFALWASFELRLLNHEEKSLLFNYINLFLPLSSVVIFFRLKLYKSISRYINTSAILIICKGLILSSILFTALIYLFQVPFYPRSIPLIYSLISLFLIILSRYSFIKLYEKFNIHIKGSSNALIYGAGEAGLGLLSSLKNNVNIHVKGFIDDDPNLVSNFLSGKKVYSIDSVKNFCKKSKIDLILLAIPSITSNQKEVILNKLSVLNLKVKIIPSIEKIINGEDITNFRDIALDDILERKPIKHNPLLISESIKNKSVFISGAGGTIGSEIARKSLHFGAKEIILMDTSEYALYKIDKELKNSFSNSTIFSYLASITDKETLEFIFSKHSISTVYHAAAYKHVPLVESNPFTGIYNNVWGTLFLANISKAFFVERFILVSSDKAVRPTNIMGASKRISELILQSLSEKKDSKTIFCMVRFGNVLGSSGSVVPLFQEQINNKGPVIVTHSEINRFFMTLDEASSLVIQAGSIAEGGEVYLLEMGKPVKIKTLAEKMIRLSGLTVKSDENPNGDIEIIYSGLRPGEKLYEELLINNESFPTAHPMIYFAKEEFLPADEINRLLNQLKESIKEKNLEKLKGDLSSLVKGYKVN